MARRRILTLGQRNADYAEVLSGIKAGEICHHPSRDNVMDGRSVASWN